MYTRHSKLGNKEGWKLTIYIVGGVKLGNWKGMEANGTMELRNY